MQTAIVIRHGGHDILVRLDGIHVPADQIKVDYRSQPTNSWTPKQPYMIEVRLENG